MSRAYKFHESKGLYFISFATVGWIDVFTRKEYKDMMVNSILYCQTNKGLGLFAWCIMSNHVHLIAKANADHTLSEILRDLKKFTSKQIIKAIQDNPQESRKEWMLRIFSNAGSYNPNNTGFQFWRQDNKPIELFTAEVTKQKLDYLHQNPVEAGFVDYPEDYPYSSARDYIGKAGLLKIELLY